MNIWDIFFHVKKMTEEYNHLFENRLNLIDDDFVNQLKIANAYISGSFVISTLLNEEYENSDIDIYVLETEKSLEDYLCGKLGGFKYKWDNYGRKFKSFYIILPSNIVVNIIPVKENIPEYINTITDLDICSSKYNGYNCEYCPSIFEKVANSINSPGEGYYDLHKKKMRIIKYKERGFHVNTSLLEGRNIEELKDIYESDKIIKRNIICQIFERLKYFAHKCKNNDKKLGVYKLGFILAIKRENFRPLREGSNFSENFKELSVKNFPWVAKW